MCMLKAKCKEMGLSLKALSEMRPICDEPQVIGQATSELVEPAPRTAVLDRKHFLRG